MAEAPCRPLELFEVATCSHAGLGGRTNQDYFLSEPSLGLSVVSDGVGGQGDGAWASQRAITLFADKLAQGSVKEEAPEELITQALRAVSEVMLRDNRASAKPASGTTIAGVWVLGSIPSRAICFNVGDSAIFCLSAGILTKVSKDHSLYQLWLDGGQVGKEPTRRTITQALGISELLSPHIAVVPVIAGDKILLCTDGLAQVPLNRVTDILKAPQSSRDACESLIAATLEGPARDNITVSVCNF